MGLKDTKPKVLYTRAEPALVKALAVEMKRRRGAQQGVKLSQSDVIRALLWEALKTAAMPQKDEVA